MLITAAVAAGAAVQGSIGIGLGLLAGPVLLFVDPLYAPGPMLIMSVVVNTRNLVADRADLDRNAYRWAAYGVPVGIVAGVAVLALISSRDMALLVGVAVCVSTAVMLAGFRPRRSGATDNRAAFATGTLTAFSGYAAGLPGPPMAVGFHDLDPAGLRAMAGRLVGIVIAVALVILTLTGRYRIDELKLTAWSIPGLLIGLLAARWIRPLLQGRAAWFRPLILAMAFFGGLSLIIRQL